MCISPEPFTATILVLTWFSVFEPSVKIITFAFPSEPERSTGMWLSWVDPSDFGGDFYFL